MSPVLLEFRMLNKKEIQNFLDAEFSETGFFLVDVLIKPGNIVRVFVDKPEGVTIQECSEVSRKITGRFDREIEDYSLDVSSPGLDMPLKVPMQFEKNLNREVSVQLMDGKKRKGILTSYNKESVTISETVKQAVEGSKNKKIVQKDISLKFDDIKAVKVIISFK